MTKIIIALLAGWSIQAETKEIRCTYIYQQVPLVTITVGLSDEGVPQSPATMEMIGSPAQKQALTAVSLAEDETLHVWFPNPNPKTGVEMVVYQKAHPSGQSRLSNYNYPEAIRDIWGNCTGN